MAASLAALSSPAAYEELLTALMDASNETRSCAEALFEECKKLHPEQLIAFTVRCLRTSCRQELRDLTAVLLRKARACGPPSFAPRRLSRLSPPQLLAAGDAPLWARLQPATQAGVKTELLNCLREEESGSTLRKACAWKLRRPQLKLTRVGGTGGRSHLRACVRPAHQRGRVGRAAALYVCGGAGVCDAGPAA